ncbi:MAG: hypothetical protein MZV64_36005 [Ignavibacteriales bacterium]|nr:hypothetical protein [Ignavibacteriales bacterium]
MPLYGDMLRQIFITPLLGIIGAKDTALWFGQSATGLFLTCLIVCVVASIFVALGMKWYAKIQKVCFWLAWPAWWSCLAFLLFGNNADFSAGLERDVPAMFGGQENTYAATQIAGQEAGAIAPLAGGTFTAILLSMPFIVFFNLWPNWGTTLYGEIRGANDFQAQFPWYGIRPINNHGPCGHFLFLINKNLYLGLLYAGEWSLVELRMGIYHPGTTYPDLALSCVIGNVHDLQPDTPVHRNSGDELMVVWVGWNCIPVFYPHHFCRCI